MAQTSIWFVSQMVDNRPVELAEVGTRKAKERLLSHKHAVPIAGMRKRWHGKTTSLDVAMVLSEANGHASQQANLVMPQCPVCLRIDDVIGPCANAA